MPAELLWIIKGPTSEHLSQSSRLEESRIRHHVQTHRPSNLQSKSQTGRPSGAYEVSRGDIVQQQGGLATFDFQSLPKARIGRLLNQSSHILTETERNGLDFYINRTARECSGWQDDRFWNTLVIQACQTSPQITHALVSIAAWHRGLSELSNSSDAAKLSALTSSQWFKTLAFARASASIAYSTTLIHCVILACLQAHQSDYQDFRLLRSAGAMLRELDNLGRGVPEPERDLIDGQVRPLIERLQARICTICDLPAALYRSVQKRHSLNLTPRRCPRIPACFSTLRQARDCLEGIFDWAHDHILVGDERHTLHHSSLTDNLVSIHLAQWDSALIRSSGAFSLNAAALLRLSYLHGLILIQTCPACDEMVFDAHIPTFRNMMDILTSFSPASLPNNTISFGIDSGLLDIVAFIATRCREPSVRYAAIAWLQTASRIEGDRLSIVSAQIACAWLRLEETGLSRAPECAADIPAGKRLKLVSGARYHANGLVMLEFADQAADYDGAGRKIKVCIDERHGTSSEDLGMDICQEQEEYLGLPDVLIERCGAAFLEDAATKSYHRVEIERFFFPIPRI